MRRLGLPQPEEPRRDSKGNAHFQIGSQMNKGMRGHVGSSSLGEVAQAGPDGMEPRRRRPAHEYDDLTNLEFRAEPNLARGRERVTPGQNAPAGFPCGERERFSVPCSVPCY